MKLRHSVLIQKQNIQTENNITIDLDKTFLFKMLESEGNISRSNQHSQSNGDVFGLQEMFDDTPPPYKR